MALVLGSPTVLSFTVAGTPTRMTRRKEGHSEENFVMKTEVLCPTFAVKLQAPLNSRIKERSTLMDYVGCAHHLVLAV